jgi:hypothetical protein
MNRLALATVCILHLTACAISQKRIVTDSVYIANTVYLQLPDPAETSIERYATQTLTGRYQDDTFEMQLRLEFRRDAIVVAAFSHFGNTLFSMSYDGRSITTIGNGLVLRGLDTSYVLADILLTFSDKGLLETHLHGEALEVVDRENRRTIIENGTPIVDIHYQDASRWSGRVHFLNLEREYEYEIETVQVDTQ